MKNYNINFTIKDIDFIFDLASIGHVDLLNYPELFELKKNNYRDTILHRMAMHSHNFSPEKRDKIINFILSIEDMDKYKNLEGDTPLHTLGYRGCTRIIEHPLFNTCLNNSYETPYCILLQKVTKKDLKEVVIPKEIIKALTNSRYLGPKMPLDHIEKRSHKPSLQQLNSWGVPISFNPKEGRRSINFKDIEEFKKKNSVLFILSD